RMTSDVPRRPSWTPFRKRCNEPDRLPDINPTSAHPLSIIHTPLMTVALTIAGSDSGGGAGIQADIKSMQANGVFAASVLTAVTAQNTVAVTDAFELPLALIEKQIDAVFEDLPIRGTKTGMLSSAQVIDLVARKLEARRAAPLVVDPVMISKSGFPLLAD